MTFDEYQAAMDAELRAGFTRMMQPYLETIVM